jgi:hypothetical protein
MGRIVNISINADTNSGASHRGSFLVLLLKHRKYGAQRGLLAVPEFFDDKRVKRHRTRLTARFEGEHFGQKAKVRPVPFGYRNYVRKGRC